MNNWRKILSWIIDPLQTNLEGYLIKAFVLNRDEYCVVVKDTGYHVWGVWQYSEEEAMRGYKELDRFGASVNLRKGLSYIQKALHKEIKIVSYVENIPPVLKGIIDSFKLS